jgi:hypothetical protein
MSDVEIIEISVPDMIKEVYVGFYRFKGRRKWEVTGTFENIRECMEALDDIWGDDIDVKTAIVKLPI